MSANGRGSSGSSASKYRHERPVIGCAICTWSEEAENERKRRFGERGLATSQGVVVVLVPYYGSECSPRGT